MTAVLAAILVTLSARAEAQPRTHTDADFHGYWYTQGAEISRYELTQARYGELHKGHAILLYVTEKLRSDTQVKADDPSEADLPVLKLNAQRKFYTGIYPYSVMTSVFSPVAAEACAEPVKITTSAQEWCGQVYLQMNLRDDTYAVTAHSYFEQEGDQSFTVPRTYSEDGLFNLVRIAPDQLPTGTFDLIPDTLHSRLMHQPLKANVATGSLGEEQGLSLEGNPLASYTLQIPHQQRTLKIVFARDFPHRIERWEDTYPSLPFAGDKLLTTTAVRTHTIMNEYWNHNANGDRALLDQLGLTPHP